MVSSQETTTARSLRAVPTPQAMPADTAAVSSEERERAEIARARAALPGIDPVAYDCYLGELTRAVQATTEADPVGILASLLCAAGVYLGRTPHIRAGDDPHPLLVWPMIIGRTGGGRKGAGWSTTRRLLNAADADFLTVNTRSGLTSGEGLAAMFTSREGAASEEAAADGKDGKLPPGDTRLLVFEAEWGGVMAKMKREGNSLSATLRAAWEGGDLSTLAVFARIARDTHVGILAHITPEEFRAKLSASDLAGGTYNRFLPIAVSRTQFLPLSQGADAELVDTLGEQLAHRLHQGRHVGTLSFTGAAATLWRELYVELGSDHGEHGPVEQFIARAAPNCLRIAAIHAVLDGHSAIDTTHLHAAAALVRYSIASARAVFTDTTTLNQLATWISAAGEQGRTRQEISDQYFHRNAKAADITQLLEQLITAGHITRSHKPPASGKGRPTELYHAHTEATKKTK